MATTTDLTRFLDPELLASLNLPSYAVPGVQKNPIPTSVVPGASQRRSSRAASLGNVTQYLQNLLPYITEAYNKQLLPTAVSELETAAAVSPAYAKMMSEMYGTYGPELSKIGSDILRQQALSQAETDKAVLEGPGVGIAEQLAALSRKIDPEFFKTREATSARLNEMLAGGLSETEREEIRKGLVQEGIARGDVNAPSQLSTVANAMQYGQAGRDRLSQAIAASTAFLPASRTGVDIFQATTGKPSTYNPGAQQFTGIQKPSGLAQQGVGSQQFNTLAGLNQQLEGIASSQNWLSQAAGLADVVGKWAGVGGQIIGGVAGGMCWIAQEVYGKDNPMWQLFRVWLLTKAPSWFMHLYRCKGQQVAEYLRDKPEFKNKIRLWMDKQIATLY